MAEQQNGMQKPLLQELPVISDRASFLYLEHCKISREDGAVTARDEEGTVHIPAAAVSVLLFGPGTEVSHRAMELIGLFPALAGVIPPRRPPYAYMDAFPRTRGGDLLCHSLSFRFLYF